MRNEDGFTLIEVLAAMAVGLVLLGATLGLLESTVRLNTGVMAKTDSMQRGRLAMDTLTQQLRSQVCLDLETSALLAGSNADQVTFYSDFGAGDRPPVKRTLRFDPATRRILSLRYDLPTPTPNPLTPGSYPVGATASNMVLENAVLQQDPAEPLKTIPFLRYFAYTPDASGVLRPERELTPPLDETEADEVSLVEITFVSRPTGAADNDKAVILTDQVVARHTDPNIGPNPACV